ncbi:high-potential iron-sulfur protein [Halococcus thailandensis]|uniref:high-potential iron-sulfur protein n=1 Tax=Halococcus thailandensis TaxID=335952 RepID=UPI0009B5CEC4|nr:high-potential iron-sulfur protein [Halococcus thailandensis]
MDRITRKSRRTVLQLAGSAAIAGFAGCTSNDGTGDQDAATTESTEGTDSNTGGRATAGEPETTPEAADGADSVGTATEGTDMKATNNGTPALSGPVPDVYRTATSQGGTKRSSDALQPKNAVQYQTQPKDSQQCSGCIFYIPDKNGDGVGACSVVEGYIQPTAWCASYSPYQNSK